MNKTRTGSHEIPSHALALHFARRKGRKLSREALLALVDNAPDSDDVEVSEATLRAAACEVWS